MSDQYLELVIECEHEFVLSHRNWYGPGNREFVPYCPGGSRVRVEPDCEAAMNQAAALEGRISPSQLAAIVDAALNGDTEQ